MEKAHEQRRDSDIIEGGQDESIVHMDDVVTVVFGEDKTILLVSVKNIDPPREHNIDKHLVPRTATQKAGYSINVSLVDRLFKIFESKTCTKICVTFGLSCADGNDEVATGLARALALPGSHLTRSIKELTLRNVDLSCPYATDLTVKGIARLCNLRSLEFRCIKMGSTEPMFIGETIAALSGESGNLSKLAFHFIANTKQDWTLTTPYAIVGSLATSPFPKLTHIRVCGSSEMNLDAQPEWEKMWGDWGAANVGNGNLNLQQFYVDANGSRQHRVLHTFTRTDICLTRNLLMHKVKNYPGNSSPGMLSVLVPHVARGIWIEQESAANNRWRRLARNRLKRIYRNATHCLTFTAIRELFAHHVRKQSSKFTGAGTNNRPRRKTS